jgi:single-stranded DNA-binding protein
MNKQKERCTIMENLLENNKVTEIGTVVEECTFSHKLFGEDFYEFKLEVQRLSDSSDVLVILVSDRLVNHESLKVGDKIVVNGQIRSYNNHADGGNKLKLVVFARDIKAVNEEEQPADNPNQVFLNGFVCKQPIYRKTPLGREICDIILAVNRTYHKSDYIPIITWGRNAKFSETLQVGDNIKVWGRIQSRDYTKKLDEETMITKTAYEVSISKMELDNENNNRKSKE